jgi:hypothetical protein
MIKNLSRNIVVKLDYHQNPFLIPTHDMHGNEEEGFSETTCECDHAVLFHGPDDYGHEVRDPPRAHGYDHLFALHERVNDCVHGRVHAHGNARGHDCVLYHHVYEHAHERDCDHVRADVYAYDRLPYNITSL